MEARSEAVKYTGGAPASDPAWRVVISPGPSRRARAWVAAVAAAALSATLAADIAAPAKAAALAALAIAAFRADRRHGRALGPGAVRRFRVDLSGRVQAELDGGRAIAGALADGSFAAPWLAIVRWRPDGARFARSLVVFPDAVEAGAHRRLRILLRWR